MTFSVVIPTYNRAKFLPLAIDSILAQTHKALEIIVVDDGSDDKTPEVARMYGDKILYLHQSNSGVSAARNRGIRAARGDWVTFLDSDDEWLSNCLATHADHLRRYPGIVGSVVNALTDCCGRQSGNWFEDNGILNLFCENNELFIERPFCAVARFHIAFIQCTAFSRNALLESRHFDENLHFGEDWDIIAQMSLMGPFVFNKSATVRAIRRKEAIVSLSQQYSQNAISMLSCWSYVFERFLNEELLDAAEIVALRKKYASELRGVANLCLRADRVSAAREKYIRAVKLDRSLKSFARLFISFLPLRLAKIFIKGEFSIQIGSLQ